MIPDSFDETLDKLHDALVIPFAGVDSPEVVFAALGECSADIRNAAMRCREAFGQFVDSCLKAIAPIIRAMMQLYQELYQELRRMHLIPRTYRLTIMRKKINRYYMQART